MPPKCRFTKEEIVSAAVKITREKGFEAVSARSVGTELGSSQNVIFSSFDNMEKLKEAVVTEADRVYREYLKKGAESGRYPPYKASGMAYIRFAREEKELFRLLFMRDRTGETFRQNVEEVAPIAEYLSSTFGLTREEAELLHLKMWIFVHGIAVMLVTSYLDLDEEKISGLLSSQFEGMKAAYDISDEKER